LTFDPLNPEHGFNEVTLVNVEDCRDTIPKAGNMLYMHIHPKVYVFYVEPAVTFNKINLQITIFISGMVWLNPDNSAGGEAIKTITLKHATNSSADLVYTYAYPNGTATGEIVIKDGNFNRLQIVVPAGAQRGRFNVTAESRIGCQAVAANLFEVLSEATVPVTDVEPRWLNANKNSGIKVKNTASQFVSTPRIYLNPQGGSAKAVAHLLPGAVFKNENLLTAVVPKGIALGSYQIIVINPDNSIGVMNDAVIVLDYDPPFVETVNPGSFKGTSAMTTTIVGSSPNSK
jgi:hypothetical protein